MVKVIIVVHACTHSMLEGGLLQVNHRTPCYIASMAEMPNSEAEGMPGTPESAVSMPNPEAEGAQLADSAASMAEMPNSEVEGMPGTPESAVSMPNPGARRNSGNGGNGGNSGNGGKMIMDYVGDGGNDIQRLDSTVERYFLHSLAESTRKTYNLAKTEISLFHNHTIYWLMGLQVSLPPRAVTTIEATEASASVKILTTKLTAPVITTNSTDYQPHPHQYDLCTPV